MPIISTMHITLQSSAMCRKLVKKESTSRGREATRARPARARARRERPRRSCCSAERFKSCGCSSLCASILHCSVFFEKSTMSSAWSSRWSAQKIRRIATVSASRAASPTAAVVARTGSRDAGDEARALRAHVVGRIGGGCAPTRAGCAARRCHCCRGCLFLSGSGGDRSV